MRASRLAVIIFTCLILVHINPLHADESIRIVSQNMNRFFDNINDGKNEKLFSRDRFYRKVNAAGTKIINQFNLPDILALQEVENRNVLAKISDAVHARSGVRYQAFLLEGSRFTDINVAYLVKQRFKVKSVKQLFKHERLAYDQSKLFSRPPLYLEACIESNCLSLLNLHLRSMRDIRSSSKGERVRLKRLEQSSVIARWLDSFQRSRPGDSIMVLGDFNGLTPSDTYVDVVGIILGQPNNSNTEKQAVDWISRDLIDLTRAIPKHKRYSYIYRKQKQILDYMLTNAGFKPRLINIAFTRIDYKFSDHAALVADFAW
ncbi:MAG: endonuclease/exonuclease/phosphatase family protein [Planctomycetota bacterium]|jgi:endonuclease/exonuclease/phosphatase family metal-dependent hydrolase